MSNTERGRSDSGKPEQTFDDAVEHGMGMLVRLIAFLLVWAWRLPVVSLPTIGICVLGWRYGATWAVATAILYFGAMVGWAIWHPESLRRMSVDRIRFRSTVWRRYRCWPGICADCGLSRTKGDDIATPKLVRVQLGAVADILTVKPVRGQTLTDFTKAADALADALDADTVTASRPTPGQIVLTVQRDQPLSEPVTPPPTPLSRVGRGNLCCTTLHPRPAIGWSVPG